MSDTELGFLFVIISFCLIVLLVLLCALISIASDLDTIKNKRLYVKDEDGNEYEVVATINLSNEKLEILKKYLEEQKDESNND